MRRNKNVSSSDSNFADGWIYGADFSEEQAKKIADISGIKTDTDLDFHNIGSAYLSQKVLPEEMRINNEIIFTCDLYLL